jgi:GNAT superfamily N-acetyltransferase
VTAVQIPMSFEHFQRMPRHPDWKFEYADGALQLSHRPRLIPLQRDLIAPPSGRHQARPVTPADLPRLRGFLAELWRTEEPYSVFDDAVAKESLEAGLDDSLGGLADPAGALVEEDGELIGATLVEQLRYADAPCLTWLSVRWGYRRDGVATALLATVVDGLRSAGADRLESFASVGNAASIAWHWRSGFQALPDPVARFRARSRRS